VTHDLAVITTLVLMWCCNYFIISRHAFSAVWQWRVSCCR